MLLVAAAFPVRMFYGKWMKKQDSIILNEGISTTGTVYFKFFFPDESESKYIVRYEFTVNGTVYKSYATYRDNGYFYNKAVVGAKYIVRYLPGDPGKIDNSRIYLDSLIIAGNGNMGD